MRVCWIVQITPVHCRRPMETIQLASFNIVYWFTSSLPHLQIEVNDRTSVLLSNYGSERIAGPGYEKLPGSISKRFDPFSIILLGKLYIFCLPEVSLINQFIGRYRYNYQLCWQNFIWPADIKSIVIRVSYLFGCVNDIQAFQSIKYRIHINSTYI